MGDGAVINDFQEYIYYDDQQHPLRAPVLSSFCVRSSLLLRSVGSRGASLGSFVALKVSGDECGRTNGKKDLVDVRPGFRRRFHKKQSILFSVGLCLLERRVG